MLTNYQKIDYYYRQHYIRWKKRVENRKPHLTCQDCGGEGGEIEPVLDYGQGPWYDCGWCEGTGLVDNWRRTAWLRCMRNEKRKVIK